MKEWFLKFINEDGKRLVFMFISTVFGVCLWYFGGMEEAGSTILIGVAAIAANKMRSPKDENITK